MLRQKVRRERDMYTLPNDQHAACSGNELPVIVCSPVICTYKTVHVALSIISPSGRE